MAILGRAAKNSLRGTLTVFNQLQNPGSVRYLFFLLFCVSCHLLAQSKPVVGVLDEHNSQLNPLRGVAVQDCQPGTVSILCSLAGRWLLG
jgi:hypothetical protein